MVEETYWNTNRETMSQTELRELQNEKIRKQVAYNFHNSPIIRELWESHDMSPDDIDTIDDLTAAPVFRKDNARNRQIERHEPFGGRLCRPYSELEEDGAFLCTSSGTTGVSTNVAFSDRDIQVLSDCFARGLWQVGLRPGDVFLSLDLTYHYIGKTAPRGAKQIGAMTTQVHHDPSEVPRLVHTLEYLEPSNIVFISPPIKNAVDSYIEENDLDPRKVWEPVQSVFYGGEPLIEAARSEMEERWGIEIFEWAGGLEPGWFGVECKEHRRWLHVASDHFYLGARDPETGNRIPDGERGELVLTPLSYDAMAHLCWAHDDIVEIERGTCECGRTGTRVKFIGRIDDLVTVEGTDVLPYDVLPITYDLKEMRNDLFQFYRDSQETLRLRLGYDEDAVLNEETFISMAKERLEDGLSVPIEIVEVLPERNLRDLGPEHKVPRVVK